MEPQTGRRIPATDAETLVDVLEFRATHNPDDLCYHIMQRKQDPHEMTYGELHRRSLVYAAAIRAQGVKAGDKVLIMLPTGPEFFWTFFGILLLGAVPVPVYPPFRLGHLDEYVDRLASLVKNAEAVGVVAFKRVRMIANLVKRQTQLRFLLTVESLADAEEALSERWPGKSGDTALIQYTSGSTGAQKGVVLSHRNILHNMWAIGVSTDFTPDTDVCVTWLPLYHDMGLIGTVLNAFTWGMRCVVIPPELFVRNPLTWLWAFTKHRGTHSPAPNFAYNLCVKKFKPSAVEGLDLSSWRVGYCGAEPIHKDTIEAFTQVYEPYGFRPETFYPVYGLAENALAVTFPKFGTRPHYDRVVENLDEETGLKSFPPANEDDSDEQIKEWVSCGRPLPEHEVEIRSLDGKRLPDRVEGEICIRSPSVMQGYYRNPEATAETLKQGWLCTRDLGYLADGRLYVTGRIKDMIIKGGRNYYPQDIEAAAGDVPGSRKGCVAAFGCVNPKRATEDIVCAVETKLTTDAERRELDFAIKDHVFRFVGCKLDHLLLCEPGTLPKTSSGKIQRYMARKLYESGKLGRKSWAGWQVGKAFVKSIVRSIRSGKD